MGNAESFKCGMTNAECGIFQMRNAECGMRNAEWQKWVEE